MSTKVDRSNYYFNPRRPMRRTSLISPWGVGAIVPFPDDESLMVAGLDMWRYQDAGSFRIEDDRLARRLGVQELRNPPDFRDSKTDSINARLTIPMVRFPRWHYCPFCGQMKKATYYSDQPRCDAIQWEKGRVCKKPGSKMIPERFIVVCPEGHIDDFPLAKWLHDDGLHTYDSGSCVIRRSTGGSSAALTGVFYECTCGAKKSLGGIMNKGFLKRAGYQCKCSKPWLGLEEDNSETCAADPMDVKVVLRNATNVWFPEVVSSILIPVGNTTANITINAILNEIGSSLESQADPRTFLNVLATMKGVDSEELYNAYLAKMNGEQAKPKDESKVSEEE